jgi:AraC-like DNA-binding protein
LGAAKRRDRNPGRTERVGEKPAIGLMRRQSVVDRPAGTMGNLFANLAAVDSGEMIGTYPERHLQGVRLNVAHSEGHGTWELYRLDQDLFVVAMQGTYDEPRNETVPGEGLIEMHLRLSGVLEMQLPGVSAPLTVAGPCLLIMFQPSGVEVSERLLEKIHDASVTLYCKPRVLTELATRSGVGHWDLLDEMQRSADGAVWFKLMELSPSLAYTAKSLLENRHAHCLRLLYAEAKALEILCEVIAATQLEPTRRLVTTEADARRLDEARRLLATSVSRPLRIRDLARTTGMSESKLKAKFKDRFGITVFDYGVRCRMSHALELLRCRRMTVCEVAYAVGYKHQTSFAAAFRDYFGFQPSQARKQGQ